MLICTYKEQVCIKKDHEKFKILDILAVTTQAHEGIETRRSQSGVFPCRVTTQALEGIETLLPLLHSKFLLGNNSSPHPVPVPGKKT